MKQPEVLIIGSGVMGRGIAKSFVSAGIPTAILSRNVANVTPGVDERVALIEKLPPNAPELIIEAVPEKMPLKLKSYAAIEAAYAGKPVLASNTSTLDLEELARPLQHPDRFLGIHYFMPADVNAVVEVAPVRATSTAATDAAVRWIEASGKSVLRLKRAVPGDRKSVV
jgi:3-hydroxybutyryl-CoA dehydrogenase